MATTKRYRRRRRRRNSHYGVLFLIILLLLLVVFGVVKLFGAIFFNQNSNTAIYQMQNATALYNGKLYTPEAGAELFVQKGTDDVMMVPVRMMNETLGTKTEWDNTTQTITMKWKRNKLQLQIGSTEMAVGDKKITLRAAPMLENGASYLPLADIAAAYEWQLHQVDEADGGYAIVSKSSKELSEKKLESLKQLALQKLGPSKAQLEEGSVLFSVGTAKVVYNGTLTTLKTTEGINANVEQDGETAKLSMQALISLFGGTTTYDEKKGWTSNVGKNTVVVSNKGKLTVNGKKVSADGAQVFVSELDKTVMVTPQAAAAMVGYIYTPLEEGIFALTSVPVENLTLQLETLKASAGPLKSSLALATLPQADHYIALTFDDGPTGATAEYPEGMTAHLLDELKARDVRATFFMCGYRLKDFNSHCSRYLAEGHELGNHTMTHPMPEPTYDLRSLSEEEIRSQITDNNDMILQHCGAKPTVFRAVGGGLDERIIAIAKEQGLPIIKWNVDTFDWQNKANPEVVKQNILDNVSDGDIVLIHDLYQGSIEGVLLAIDALNAREETYAFVTVSQLAELKGITLEPGVEYSRFKDAAPAETPTDGAATGEDRTQRDVAA